MFRRLLLSALFFFAAALTYADDWGAAAADGSLFGSAETGMQVFNGVRFYKVDETTRRLGAGTVEMGKLEFGEMLVKCAEDGAIRSLRLMIYNKGDDGDIDKEAFNARRETAVAALDELTGTKGRQLNVGAGDSGVKVKAMVWKTEHAVFRMESSAATKGGFKAEFIRLDIGPDEDSISRGGARDAAGKSSLKGHVKHEEDGTVIIEGVPMVDQGMKGYCAPATLSRLFAYYGMDGVDQHALAALCNSQGSGGTSTADMQDAMERICKKFHIRITTLEDYHSVVTSICEPYNKIAKKKDKPFINPADDPLAVADPAILKQARAPKPAVVDKWMKDIRKSIDAGIPVLWGVKVGIYQEPVPLPQARGGHMRLIIGYNPKKRTVIYTDSWGAGHERKEIDAADALSMTTGRHILKPSK
ncbi:MAG: C39 family peptidase [Akkermansia sp.]|nr:C39 family peptidase [Akkermansia sp.]